MTRTFLLFALLLGAGATISKAQPAAGSTTLRAPLETGSLSSFKEEEVSFENGDIHLAGTLAIPDTDGPHPAVVLLSMGGAQSRDSESFDFRIFQVLSDYLANHGVAVLRFDDRGVGGSTGDMDASTLSDLAEDAIAAVSALKRRSDIDPTEIGVLGHSQGGIVAPLAASLSSDIAFVVLMGAPMLPAAIMAAEAQARALRAFGASEEQIESGSEVQRLMFSAAAGDTTWAIVEEVIESQIRTALGRATEDQLRQIGDVDVFVQNRTASEIAPFKRPLFASIVNHSPAETLASLSVPVLTVFGGRDTQIPSSLHAPPTHKALEEAGVENSSHVFPEANHQFQLATTGDPAEYPTLESSFVQGFLELGTQWIHYQTRK